LFPSDDLLITCCQNIIFYGLGDILQIIEVRYSTLFVIVIFN